MIRLRHYDGYLFDLDGTLIDTAPDLNNAQNAALAAHGYPAVCQAQTRLWVGHGARFMLEQSLQTLQIDYSEAALSTMHQQFLTHYEANIAEASLPYADVVETLATLAARGAKLAVVTNKTERLSRTLLAALGLTAHFDVIIGGDTAARSKPAADPAALACGQMGLGATDVLFVGDSTTDVGCARAFGCDVVCVSYGYNQGVTPASLGADRVIDSFAELL